MSVRKRSGTRVLLWRLTRVPRRAASRWWETLRPRGRETISLEHVHRRLELLLAAMYGRHIAIEQPDRRRRTMRERVVNHVKNALRRGPELAETSNGSIALPHVLDAADGESEAMARYRLLAVEQAERLTRGTPAVARLATSPLERDLFLIAESAAADAAIGSRVPGLRSTLIASRAEALERRPPVARLGGLEGAVEGLVRHVLGDSAAAARELPSSPSPAESLAWARTTAVQLKASHDSVHYHGIAPVTYWGRVRDEPTAASGGTDDTFVMNAPTLNLPGSDLAQARVQGKSDDNQQTADGSSQDVEDTRATGAAVRDTAGSADSPMRSALPDPSAAPLDPDDQASSVVDNWDDAPGSASSDTPSERGIAYDEWDHEQGRYVTGRVTVRVVAPKEGEERWSRDALAEYAGVVRRVRQRFERLRARRMRLDRQRDGEELDITACVRALVDRRVGLAMDDRLYASVRPARRAIAIMLLVDVSGSTDAKVDDTRRIIDVERTSLLVASEALDALGDRYAILTFSGRGAHDVRLTTMKDFAERRGDGVWRRIAAMEPQGNTRFGAAVRHATHLLAHEPAGHHLLLILSDGRPNDVDGYHEEYGVADTRQAVHEARAQGVFPFCLTVDRNAAEYLPHIFGIAGHAVLRDPRQLPMALVKAVQQLVRQ